MECFYFKQHSFLALRQKIADANDQLIEKNWDNEVSFLIFMLN